MGLFTTLRFILDHPLNRSRRLGALGRYAAWQVRSTFAREPLEVGFVDGTRLLVSKGQTGATGNIYAGLHELPEMALVLHLLRPGELFVDVGANVGSYTVLASGAVHARCIAFEPDPATVRSLRANIDANGASGRVDVRQAAVGSKSGTVMFSAGQDTLNHVVAGAPDAHSITVPLTTLDESLEEESPALIKIDVEGYETDVIRGGEYVLRRDSLIAVIMETNGSGERYSASDDDLHARMLSLGFSPCDYDPFTRHISIRAGRSPEGNTIYVRDVAAASSRVKSSRKFDIAGRHSL